MRKIFGGSLVFSLVGVALLGGVFAWNFSASDSDSNTVGFGDLAMQYNSNGNILGPDGVTTVVGAGGLGTNGDFVLAVDLADSSVVIDTVPPSDDTCTVSMFEGFVTSLSPGVLIDSAGFVPGDYEFSVNILTHSEATAAGDPLAVPASEACMNQTVFYTVNITAHTTGALIP